MLLNPVHKKIFYTLLLSFTFIGIFVGGNWLLLLFYVGTRILTGYTWLDDNYLFFLAVGLWLLFSGFIYLWVLFRHIWRPSWFSELSKALRPQMTRKNSNYLKALVEIRELLGPLIPWFTTTAAIMSNILLIGFLAAMIPALWQIFLVFGRWPGSIKLTGVIPGAMLITIMSLIGWRGWLLYTTIRFKGIIAIIGAWFVVGVLLTSQATPRPTMIQAIEITASRQLAYLLNPIRYIPERVSEIQLNYTGSRNTRPLDYPYR